MLTKTEIKTVVSLRQGVKLYSQDILQSISLKDMILTIPNVRVLRAMPSGRVVTIVSTEEELILLKESLSLKCYFSPYQTGEVL